MEHQLLYQDIETQAIYDITSLAGNIVHTTFLKSQPGKLSFSLKKDPNNILTIKSLKNGSVVQYKIDSKKIFFGFIFSIEADITETYKIVAYDTLRYLKNEDTRTTEKMSASMAFTNICSMYNLKHRVETPSSYIVPPILHDKVSLYSIIDKLIERANVYEEKNYFIKCDFDTLVFTELAMQKSPLIIGDRSLLTSYQYARTIDSDTYNKIVVIKDDDKDKSRIIVSDFDPMNQKRWGVLQMMLKAEKEQNQGQMKDMATKYLKLKNRETKTIKIAALGEIGLNAGSGFTLKIDDLGIEQFMWIESATHNFDKNFHTMSLEVSI